MCSSVSISALHFPSKIGFLLHRRYNLNCPLNPFFVGPRYPRPFCLSASTAEKSSNFEFSSWDVDAPDEYNGWAIVEAAPKPIKKKVLPTFVIIGLGTSVAVVLGFIANLMLSKRGLAFRLQSPFNALRGISVSLLTTRKGSESETRGTAVELEDTEVSETSSEVAPDVVHIEGDLKPEVSNARMDGGKLERIIVPFAVDSSQQEALSVLKKLKIIEDDAEADQLCTRREFARWLVRENSQLERNRSHQIIPSVAVSGSTVTAFDDVRIEDPDFEPLQTLAEVGLIRSKLSDKYPSHSTNDSKGVVNFLPGRFISREDLISWRCKTEYKVMPKLDKEMSRKNIGFLDVKEISSDALPVLFVDVLADEKSILRRVFGQSKRFQPTKPCTKAQAAVALTSGRMTESIQTELSRLEAENTSRQIEMKEIKSQLLERGEIKRFWDKKIEEERRRGLEVEEDYRLAVNALEQEKIVQENALPETLKQNAVLDCQKQLLSSLKKEVSEMSERLALERARYFDEKHEVQMTCSDLQVKYEGLLDAKSILEAEIEALRILRSWVEDEARKSQARAKVLEEAGRRWKWDNSS